MAAGTPGLWLPVYTLWWREIVLFYRQRSRVIGALATPIFFWILIGSGIGTSVPASGAVSDGENYLHYFFPGTLVLIVLFTAIFSTISIIEDRREGFLQAVLVAPVFRSSIVLGKVLGGTTLALMQGILFLLIGLIGGMVPLSAAGTLSAVGVLFVVAFALTSLGFAIAWSMDSTQGYHSIMNLFLIPMWLLSGALFPISGAFTWIKAVMAVNPLSYGVAAVRQSLHPGTTIGSELAPLGVCLIVSILFAAVMFAAATGTAVRRTGRSLA
jgi:ABC-2 type transport system permease protein